ncbi:MAG: RtcB family protein [Sphaerochaetaceae bacterium]
MFTIKGFYNKAVVFSHPTEVDQGAINQIKDLLAKEFCQGSKIRIMSDVHSGAGSVIGTTMTIGDTVVPNLVGVDIGCGLEVVDLGAVKLDFKALDEYIRTSIPAGFKIRTQAHPHNDLIDVDPLICKHAVDLQRSRLSIGTLGGGNHFIEVNEGSEGKLYLVIHSGSRHIGLQVANHYQKIASKGSRDPLAHLEGEAFDHYLHDMQIMQHFADVNRKAMAATIIEGMGLSPLKSFSTIHNYIDLEQMILRKGAVSAQKGEELIIPLNMRDGSLLCQGKGNPNWNFSAPHGAGRILSRREAKRSLHMKQYRTMMQGIYTTSVNKATLDESPLAYKPFEQLIEHIGPAVEIIERIKPRYNFKSAD